MPKVCNLIKRPKVCNFIEKETLADVFSCEFCEIFKNTFGRLLLWTNASETSNTKYLQLIERRSKVQKKNMSCKRALNFDQCKTFSEDYKPIRVWLWLVYKCTENSQIYRLFSEFIQTKKRYPTSPDKIRILTQKLPVMSS